MVRKTDYITKITELENKIPVTTGLFKVTHYVTKIAEIDNKIPDISDLVTTSNLKKLANIWWKNKKYNKKPCSEGGITTSLDLGEGNKKKICDLNYLLGKNYFNHDDFKNHLIFKFLFKRMKLHNPDLTLIFMEICRFIYRWNKTTWS